MAQFESTELALGSSLWETVRMTKRNLRILKSAGGTPTLGVCEYCNTTFEAFRDETGFVSNKDDVRDQFEAHKCKREDASQAAARIVKEATDDH